MKAVFLIPALPLSAAAAGLVFLAAMRFRRLGWAALALYTLSVPMLAVLIYRFWDHHVGPDSFSLWQLAVSPGNISFFMPLAIFSPLLLWAAQRKRPGGKGGNAALALACIGLAAALAALLSQHLFLMVGMFAVATSSMVAATVLRGKGAARLLPSLFPPLLADFCLALGVMFLYLSDPTRGLFFPATPLEPAGMPAAACALLLAAALMRLACFPLQRWMSGMSRGGKELRLFHLLAVDLTLGTYLLFAVSRLFFVWEGLWVWVCLGIAAVTLVEIARELLYTSGRDESWGLLCAAVAAGIALVAAPGGQAATAAARLALWAGIPALALVELGSEGALGMDWAGVVGGASLMGLPPLAGFATLWMGFEALSGGFTGGKTIVFLAAIPLLFASALIAGAVALFLPRNGEQEVLVQTAAPAAVLLAACCAATGLYPGTIVDLFMREYGLPLEVPFTSWTTLGWAVLICGGLAAILSYAWTRRGGDSGEERRSAGRSLPLLASAKTSSSRLLDRSRYRVAVVCVEVLLYLAWIAVMVFLGIE
jgi:formate hydrogenlyase subunit 3/multisubunit Na+/H+ antiporter MnhD subunit